MQKPERAQRLAEAAQAEGTYQDIEVDGQTLVSGWRDCKERWQLIKHHIHPRTTILDIGSHYGYFGIKSAQLHPSNIILSVESSAARHSIQAEAVRLNDLSNVLVLRKHITLADFMELVRTVEMVDTVLALSILHYFEPEEIPQVIWCLSKLAQNVIIEFPDENESEVANKHIVKATNMERLLNLIFDSVTLVGKTPSPKDPTAFRKMYLAQSYSIKRDKLAGYVGARGGRKHQLEYRDANWYLNEKLPEHHGVNLCTLLSLDPVHPSIDDYFDKAAKAYHDLILSRNGRVTDIHPRNVLVTYRSVQIIDFKEGSSEPAIYGMSWGKYKKAALDLTVEQIEQQLKTIWITGRMAAVLNEQGALDEGVPPHGA